MLRTPIHRLLLLSQLFFGAVTVAVTLTFCLSILVTVVLFLLFLHLPIAITLLVSLYFSISLHLLLLFLPLPSALPLATFDLYLGGLPKPLSHCKSGTLPQLATLGNFCLFLVSRSIRPAHDAQLQFEFFADGVISLRYKW